jgi:hypothetical protein
MISKYQDFVKVPPPEFKIKRGCSCFHWAASLKYAPGIIDKFLESLIRLPHL